MAHVTRAITNSLFGSVLGGTDSMLPSRCHCSVGQFNLVTFICFGHLISRSQEKRKEYHGFNTNFSINYFGSNWITDVFFYGLDRLNFEVFAV